MSATSAKDLLISGLGDFGTAMLVIITLSLAVGVGFLVFRLGYNSVKNSNK